MGRPGIAVLVMAFVFGACSGDPEVATTTTAVVATTTEAVTTTALAATTAPTVAETTTTTVAETTTTTVAEWPFPPPSGVTSHADGWSASILYKAGPLVPSLVSVAPDGRVFFTSGRTSEGLEIRELRPDGTQELLVAPKLTAFEVGGRGELHDFAFTPDGRLLIGPIGHPLYVVDVDTGELDPIGGGWPGVQFIPLSDGTIVTTDRQNRLWLVDGTTGDDAEFRFDFELGWGLAVGPNDEIAVVGRTGELYDVTDPSAPRLVAAGLPAGGGGEDGVVFTPDGSLYWVGTSVVEVDLDSGTLSDAWRITSYGQVTVAPDGRLVVWHPNMGIARVDLATRVEELLYTATVNTTALATFEGTVYVAYRSAQGVTLYSIEEGGGLAPLGTFAANDVLALAIDGSGTALLAGVVADGSNPVGFPVFEFPISNPEDATQRDDLGGCPVFSLAFDRADGTIHLTNCEGVMTSTAPGDTSTVPYPADVDRGYLTVVDGGGPVYMVGWSPGFDPAEGEPHSLYRLTDGAWTKVLDLSDTGPAVTWAIPAACPDGSLYVIKHHYINEAPSGQNHLFEIGPDGARTLVLSGLGTDATAMECSADGTWLASMGIGEIFRLDRP